MSTGSEAHTCLSVNDSMRRRLILYQAIARVGPHRYQPFWDRPSYAILAPTHACKSFVSNGKFLVEKSLEKCQLGGGNNGLPSECHPVPAVFGQRAHL